MVGWCAGESVRMSIEDGEEEKGRGEKIEEQATEAVEGWAVLEGKAASSLSSFLTAASAALRLLLFK